jgi:hypothetical protein
MKDRRPSHEQGVIVSEGNSPYKVSAVGSDSDDVVVSGGSMFVLRQESQTRQPSVPVAF